MVFNEVIERIQAISLYLFSKIEIATTWLQVTTKIKCDMFASELDAEYYISMQLNISKTYW